MTSVIMSRQFIQGVLVVGALVLIGAGCPTKTNVSVNEGVANNNGGMMEEKMTVTLAAQNNSGQTGTATLTEEGEGKTKVAVRVSNAPANTPQPAHIHLGSCATIGGVKYPLTNLVNGESETMLDVSLEQIESELPLALNVHKSSAESGVYVACGDLPSDAVGVMMKGGAMMTVDAGGQNMMMKGDMMMGDGSKVTMNGKVMMKDGTEVMMKEGDTMMMQNGALMMEKKAGGSMMQKETSNKTSGTYETYAPDKLALAADGKVILFFHAPWCPTCRAVDSDISSNLTAIPANTHILKTDYDSSTELKKKYGVTYQHTFVQVDSSGNLIKKWSGGLTLNDIVKQVQ